MLRIHYYEYCFIAHILQRISKDCVSSPHSAKARQTARDGIYFKPRLEHDKQCLLVIIGAGEAGHKDIVAVSDGDRESEQSWRRSRVASWR